MNAQQVNRSFDLVKYAGSLVNLKPCKTYHIGACPICGEGRDRFNVKHTQTGDVWLCRKCSPGKYRSALDFLMEYHKEDFKAALRRAGGEVIAPEPRHGKPVIAPAPVQVLPSSDWQRDAWQLIDAANNRLMGEEEGEPGRRYLASRGISKGSILANLLGFAVVYNRPAVVVPWLDVGDIVSAVKFRFIDPQQDKARRYSMMAGSIPCLFGLRDILASDKTLLFVEGEINAIRILQTRPHGVSVVSGGGEGNGNAALLRALARHYDRAVIWTDDPARGREIRERMNRPEARLLKSPVIEGVKFDANQMLQAGLLMEFISAELKTECRGVPVDLISVEVGESEHACIS